jgi:urea transporter
VSTTEKSKAATPSPQVDPVLLPILVVFRGIGQVFFQENALSGAMFTLGVALSMPVQAVGLVVGAVIGAATAWVLKFDQGGLKAGIYGFNSALVGIATLFFFEPAAVSLALLAAGSVAAALLTRAARGYVPFPTYTAPFVVTTWVVFFVGRALGAVPVEGYPALLPNPTLPFAVEATAHGVGQVMFQGSLWTGLLFLLGIAVSDRCHAAWVLAGSVVGMLVASHHTTAALRAIDPERLVERGLFDNIALGLYGFNATLAPVALYLWRKSLIAPVLGMLLTVPLTELVPLLGLPALTAPFVLVTWIVLLLGWLEGKYLVGPAPSAS